MANGSDPASGTAGPGSVGQVSVRQRLIELEFRNGFWIGGVEPAGLIEREEALRRRPSGRQWRGLGREIEIGENGAYGNGIRNEGDDAHGNTARRADERQDIIDTSDEREAQREEVRRPGAVPSDEPATD